MWEIDISHQLLFFGRSVILGVLYCLFYDVFRALRRAKKFSDITVAVQDIIYFIIISPVTFLYLLAATNGELRFYIFLGIFFGFLLSFYSVSRVWFTVLRICFSVILKGFEIIFFFINDEFSKSSRFVGKYFKKTLNFFKKTLKKV